MTYATRPPPPQSGAPVRALLRWLMYAGVLFGSFFLTLWLTEPEPQIPNDRLDSGAGAALLALRRAETPGALAAQARAAGLRASNRMQGAIDGMERVNDREAASVGWFADLDGDGQAMTVIAFVDGTFSGMTRTAGERPDVTRAVGLGFGAEKNVSYRVVYTCRPGQQVMLVGVGASRKYALIGTRPCP